MARPIPFTYTRAAAPLIGQSDLAFRLLSRREGCDVAYTQMLMANEYVADATYRHSFHELHKDDHPLVVQFAGDRANDFVAAALLAQERGADAVDINFGCPQSTAKAGHYGAWMTDPVDWSLCTSIVRAMVGSPGLRIPVFAKMRLQPTLTATLEFALSLQEAGISLLVVHGRMRGSTEKRRAGPAYLAAIGAVKDALHIPVISNGNVRTHADYHLALSLTHADGIMSGEGLLRDPGVLACRHDSGGGRGAGEGASTCCITPEAAASQSDRARAYSLIHAYISLARLHPPPVWATVLQHVSWMLGRTGQAGAVRYMLVDPVRRIAGAALRRELTDREGCAWDWDRLLHVVEAVVGPESSRKEKKRRKRRLRVEVEIDSSSASGDEGAPSNNGAPSRPSEGFGV